MLKPSKTLTGFPCIYLTTVGDVFMQMVLNDNTNDNTDTISAIATPPGEGGIGIVRISGPLALAVADKLFRSKSGRTVAQMRSHTVHYGHVVDPANGMLIDEALLMVMRAPHSYTREDVVEIQAHGGVVPLRRILSLTLQHGARLAEPGEFTKRAFLHGRLDLAQAEAVIDIIRAKTDAALRAAANNLGGELSRRVRELLQGLVGLISHIEAMLDFPEDDIPPVAYDEVSQEVARLAGKLDDLLASGQSGRVLRDGLNTVIVGRPNVGKSSLLNALLRESRAIVTAIPGTTRDVIEEYVNVRGVPLRIADTAGIRHTSDAVERLGVEKARALLERADLVLVVLDASEPLTEEDREVLRLAAPRPTVVLLNKSDLPPRLDLQQLRPYIGKHTVLSVAAATGAGLEKLEEHIVKLVYGGQVQAGESVCLTSARQMQALTAARNSLQDAQQALAERLPWDCVTVDLRAAWEQLGTITGDTADADIIDRIFADFCVGK